jgi:hypothetical protein
VSDLFIVLQYDTDTLTWSPQGRLHQVEYAMEAVKQGSAAVGLKVTCISSEFTPQQVDRRAIACMFFAMNVWCCGLENCNLCTHPT